MKQIELVLQNDGVKRNVIFPCTEAEYQAVCKELALKDNYAFVVNTPQDVLQYDIAFCSDNEDFGYHRAEDWFHFLETWKEELSNPVTVSRVR